MRGASLLRVVVAVNPPVPLIPPLLPLLLPLLPHPPPPTRCVYVHCCVSLPPWVGGTSKKSIFLDLFRLPQNSGLKLSLDDKYWRKKNRKKIDDKYPIFYVEVGQKICLGALFSIRRFCNSVSLINALILPKIFNKNISVY